MKYATAFPVLKAIASLISRAWDVGGSAYTLYRNKQWYGLQKITTLRIRVISNFRILSLAPSLTALISHTALRFSDKIILTFTTIMTASGAICKTSVRKVAKVLVTVILHRPKGADIAKAIIQINSRNENLIFLNKMALENCALRGEQTTYQRSTLNAAKQNIDTAYATNRTAIKGVYSVQNVSFRASACNTRSVACPAMFSAEKNKSAMATFRRNRCAKLRIFLFEKIVKTIKRLPMKATVSALNSTAMKIGSSVFCRDKSEMTSFGGICGAGGPRQERFPGCRVEHVGLEAVRLSMLFSV